MKDNIKTVTIVCKSNTKAKMQSDYSDMILKNRELFIETDGVDNNTYRFKIGDGKKPYKELPYISSLYAIFPEFILCDTAYNFKLDIKVANTDGE